MYDEAIEDGTDQKQALYDMYARIEEEVIRHLLEGHDISINDDEVEEISDILEEDENHRGDITNQKSDDKNHRLAEKAHIIDAIGKEYRRIDFQDLVKKAVGVSGEENGVEILRSYVNYE